MGKSIIELDSIEENALTDYARARGMTAAVAAAKILHAALSALHTMYGEADESRLKSGYRDWGDVNLEWAELGFKE